MRYMVFDSMDLCTDEQVESMLPEVSPQRREQALRYRHTMGRFCCLKSWMMLKEVFNVQCTMYNVQRTLGDFQYNEYGKPYITGGPCFSISHCKEGIAVAVSDEPVGIDIEGIRHADEELIRRVMNPAEQEQIRSDRDFTRLWTQKEAVVKAIGTGIVSFEQLQTILVDSGKLKDERTGEVESGEWKVETFETEKYIYSIAYGKLHCISAQVPPADL